jgi:hypothetical protein
MDMSTSLQGWTRSAFTADGRTREVYRRGTGPGVIVVHEVPGITPKVAAFANDVVAAGFTVVMPSLVGTPGKAFSVPYVLASTVKVCIAAEFANWALQQHRRSSPGCAHWRPICMHRQAGRALAPSACASPAALRWR